MKTSTRLVATGLLALLAIPALADDTTAANPGTSADQPNHGDAANARLDARGE